MNFFLCASLSFLAYQTLSLVINIITFTKEKRNLFQSVKKAIEKGNYTIEENFIQKPRYGKNTFSIHKFNVIIPLKEGKELSYSNNGISVKAGSGHGGCFYLNTNLEHSFTYTLVKKLAKKDLKRKAAEHSKQQNLITNKILQAL